MITYAKLISNAKKRIDLNNLEYRAIYLFLCDILNVDRTGLMMKLEEFVSDDVLEKFSEMLADYIVDYRPIEYILGYTYFYGYKIKVREGVLIPRDESEELVEKTLFCLNDNDRVLDLCTGSGAIAIALKKEKESIEVVASDISKEALKICEENILYNNVNIDLVEGDLLTPFIGKEKFDVIVSNPPYISENFVINDIVKHEPSIALFAKENGICNYRAIIKDLDKVLNKEGILLLEIGYDQKDRIKMLCDEYLNNYSFECFKDINGKDRIIKIKLGE